MNIQLAANVTTRDEYSRTSPVTVPCHLLGPRFFRSLLPKLGDSLQHHHLVTVTFMNHPGWKSGSRRFVVEVTELAQFRACALVDLDDCGAPGQFLSEFLEPLMQLPGSRIYGG